MGCGISRFSLAEDGIRHRIEGRSREGNSSTGEEEGVVDSNDGCRSVSSPIKNPGIMKVQEESPKAADHCDTATKKLGGEEKQREVEEGREFESNKEGEEEEEERIISDCDGLLFMGSPSFREYCMDFDSEDSVNYDGNSNGEKREKETQMKEGIASPNSNEFDVRQGQTTQSEKKERRGKFRKVFPMGRPAAVKNLFHVTGCYNPYVSAAHVRPSKPAQAQKVV